MTLTADWSFWLVWGCWVASWALLFAGQDIRPIWGILGTLLLIPVVIIGASGDGKTWRALFLGVGAVFVLTVFRFVLSRLSLRLHEALIVRDLAAAGIDPTPIRRGFLKALRDYEISGSPESWLRIAESMLPDSPVSAALMQTMRELAALESAVEQTGEDVLPERIATRLLDQTGKLGQALTDRSAQIQTLTIDGADAPGLTVMFDLEMRQYEQARNAIRDAQAALTELVAAPPGVRASFGPVDSRFRMLGKSARRLRAIEYRLVPAVRD